MNRQTLFQSASLLIAMALILTLSACSRVSAVNSSFTGAFPNPTLDVPLANSKGEQTAVLAGGCFWGIEAVFDHVKGVKNAESCYSGGAKDVDYETVSSGNTGNAESVRVTYDPSQITYGQLLKVFFAVAHDPTQLNRQGPDTGTQYRSAIFYSTAEQQRVAQAYIAQLKETKSFRRPIVTEVTALKAS